MFGATTAEVALWVAIVSVTVTLTSLAWQLAFYRLSGARLVVRLVPAVLTEAGHIIRGPARGWRTSMPPEINIVQNRPWVDAAIIEMVSIGRAPISLSTINLEIGADPRWKPWRRHTVGMPPIAVQSGLADIGEVRLDPARALFAVVDFWPAVATARKLRHRVHVRASVLPAGRRAKRSPWRHRWTIGPDQHHLWPLGPEGEEVQLFQAVWRAIAPIAPNAVYDAWLSILGLLMPEDVDPKQVSILEVSTALEPILGSPIQAMWPSMSIFAALHEHGRAGAWMPHFGQQEPGPSETPPAP